MADSPCKLFRIGKAHFEISKFLTTSGEHGADDSINAKDNLVA